MFPILPHRSWVPTCRRLLLLLPVLALAADLSARSLVKVDMQLTNNAVLAMHQDEDANMWIGTYDDIRNGVHLHYVMGGDRPTEWSGGCLTGCEVIRKGDSRQRIKPLPTLPSFTASLVTPDFDLLNL